jgi:hypothetical protein
MEWGFRIRFTGFFKGFRRIKRSGEIIIIPGIANGYFIDGRRKSRLQVAGAGKNPTSRAGPVHATGGAFLPVHEAG